ncbi:MAG: glycosyltransferase family 4 protein [Hyphomicrobium sp.]|nr:glycosyltransferase family 4 protein [Hyphomicrobium sp.]
MSNGPGVLIIVENLTVPLDRRVWQEALALRDAGYTVSVICPKGGKHTAAYECLEDIHVFRHPLPYEADGALGYALEYGWALAWEFALSIKAYRKVGFDVIQACNPPDLLFVIGAFWKFLFGKRFVFDHHDLNPELYEAKFGRRGAMHRLLLWLEKLTFKVADVSIATNETFKDIALRRGGIEANRVFIVRSIPELSRFNRVAPSLALKNGRKTLLGYVGIMGAQDGVDLLIEAMDTIVHRLNRRDVQCAIVGSGTELPRLQQMVHDKGLQNYVNFTGFLSGKALLTAYSSFDIGVIPDPKNSYNDKISMNKVFEYMSLGIPFVGFDLIEGRKVSGGAALYAADNDPVDLARQIMRVAVDPVLHRALGEEGLARARSLLNWDQERLRLLAAYDHALAHSANRPSPNLASSLAVEAQRNVG